MGNGLSSDQGSFTPHGFRDVDKFGTEQRQHDWSNPEDDNMLAGAPNNEELNSLSTFNRHDGSEPTSHTSTNGSPEHVCIQKSAPTYRDDNHLVSNNDFPNKSNCFQSCFLSIISLIVAN